MVTISGEGFGTDKAEVTTTLGDSQCEIDTIEDTKIVCEVVAAVQEHEISNQGRHESMKKCFF